jgi:iron complex outermembrane recepter protein
MSALPHHLHAATQRGMLVLTAILLSMVVLVARAQVATPGPATSAPAPDAIEEILVTARRREENIQDVPLSVNAFSQAQLQTLNVVDPESLGKLDPGLTLNSDNGSRQSFTPFIRGLGAAANSPTNAVIQYFAEVPNFQPSFFDLENVQVLKGPQGTLFGETATGGAVLFTPKKPTGDFDGYVNMEHGNYDYNALSAAVEFPVINDIWSVRAAGQIRKRDGFTTLINSHIGDDPATELDNLDTSEFRVSSVIKPLENVEIYTILQSSSVISNGTDNELFAVQPYLPFLGLTGPSASPLTSAEYNYFTGQSTPAGKTWYQLLQSALIQQQKAGIGTTYAATSQATVNKFEGLINTVTWNITDKITFKDIYGAYKNYTSGVSANPDGTDLPLLNQFPALCQPGISPGNCLTTSATNWSNEAQVLGAAFADRLAWQTGFYYRDNPVTPDWSQPAGFVGYVDVGNNFQAGPAACGALGVGNTPCTTVTKSSATSYAPYFQTTFEVVKDVHLTAGYRETYDESTNYATAAPAYTTQYGGQTIPIVVLGTRPLPGATTMVTSVPRSANGSWTLAADWRLNDELLLYITRRKGYTPGGVNVGLPLGDPRTFYQAETVKDIEGGLKGDFKLGDYSIRMDVDAYYMKFDGIQEKTDAEIDGQFLGYTGNVAAATIKGVDLSLLISRSLWYDFTLLFNWNDAQYTNWTDVSTCSAESYRPACLNPLYTVTTNHVAGIVTVSNPATGQIVGVQHTSPDEFVEAPKFRVTLRPALHLGFLGEQFAPATVSANIYYTSSYTDTDINFSSGDSAADLQVNGYVQADLRLDWKRIAAKNGINLDFYAQVTNVTDRRGIISKIDTMTFDDTDQGIYNEPRMYFAGFKLSF